MLLEARHNYNIELDNFNRELIFNKELNEINEKINKFESMLINENDINKKATINQVIFLYKTVFFNEIII